MKLFKIIMLVVIVSATSYSCKESKKEMKDGDMEMINEEESVEAVEEVEVEEVVEAAVSAEAAKAIEGGTAGLEEVEVEGVIIETMADTPVIYPGCEGSADEIRACSKKKFIAFLGDNFNSDLASDLGLKSGEHKIRALVKIDESGKSSVLKVDGPNKALEKEIERVINKLPELTAATEEGKPVSVSFVLPINFMVK